MHVAVPVSRVLLVKAMVTVCSAPAMLVLLFEVMDEGGERESPIAISVHGVHHQVMVQLVPMANGSKVSTKGGKIASWGATKILILLSN